MTDRETMEMLAAEYVLGTLDAAERAEIAARRQREPELDSAIGAWERRLGPLNESTRPVAPSEDLLDRINARIDAGVEAPAATPSAGSSTADAGVVVHLRRSRARWRAGAIAASALAAGLATFVLLYQPIAPPAQSNYVAVFQKDDQQPAFLMSIDLATRELTIRAVEADRPADRSYQLWIVAEGLGEGPQSLGLLDAGLDQTRKRLEQIEPAVLRDALFGISVEPEGGSPTGKPTGPAIHGRLYPATP